MRRCFVSALAVATVASGLAASPALADVIAVQSTSDTVDAGLVDGLLRPAFRAASPGDELDYTAVGTGKALDNAKQGLADVVITHAPSLEKQFALDGFSLEPAGRAIFYSDYVILGPRADPAGVLSGAPHDAVSALEAIAAAGEAGRATFVSRGDNSGTNVQEQIMWAMTGATVVKQLAVNGRGDTRRAEPGTGATYPVWYGKTNKTQAANLLDADVCASATYPNGGCYTMVDRGTYNNLLNRSLLGSLTIVSQSNSGTARGGKDLLINPFSAYIVKPEAVAARRVVNVVAARRFIDFLVSPSFQAAIDTWPTATDPAFRADAYPSVTLAAGIPPTATAGATVPLSIALANKQPGAPVVTGMPVQLQQSTDGGATWADAGSPQLTDVAGHVSFAPAIATTTRYRLSLPQFQSTDWNMFSANVQELGVVSVPKTPDPTPIGRRRADRVAPRVSKGKLAARSLTLTVSEAASVRTTIAKRTVTRVRRNGRLRTVIRWTGVRSASATARRAGTVTLRWRRPLPAGSYRVAVVTRDAARNARRQSLRLQLTSGKRAARR